MGRDEIVRLLRTRREEVTRLGVRALRLFGSVARGDAGVHSDVDVLVEFDVTSYSPSGDIKVELFGDGKTFATHKGAYTASGYVLIFGCAAGDVGIAALFQVS